MNSALPIAIVFIASIILIVLLAVGVFRKTKPNKMRNQEFNQKLSKPNKNAYITPKPFETGYIKDSPQALANLCKNKYKDIKLPDFGNPIYPINPTYVYYGSNISPHCKCLEFIKAP